MVVWLTQSQGGKDARYTTNRRSGAESARKCNEDRGCLLLPHLQVDHEDHLRRDHGCDCRGSRADRISRPGVVPSGRGASPAHTVQATAQTATTESKPATETAGMDRVKKLAVGLAAGRAPAALFEGMPDPVVEWLGAMDRKMLCKVGCATDAQLVAHLRGKETMKGVLVYDEKAVAEYRKAQGLDLDPDLEPDIEPKSKPAMAA